MAGFFIKINLPIFANVRCMQDLNSQPMQSNSYTGEVISFVSGFFGYVLHQSFGWVPNFANNFILQFEIPLLEINITPSDIHSVVLAIFCSAFGFFTHLFLKSIMAKIKKLNFKKLLKWNR